MEIITFVKAGIKNKIGSFIGFFLLTVIIMSTVVAAIGIKKNFENALECAFENTDRGSVIFFLQNNDNCEEIKRKLFESELVDHISETDTIYSIGVDTESEIKSVSYSMEKVPENLRLCSDDMTKVYDSSCTESLKKGEIYIPYGSHQDYKVNVGDKIVILFQGDKREFTIKGYVEEPYFGTSSMGVKIYYISDEDFDEIYNSQKMLSEEENAEPYIGCAVSVYPSGKFVGDSNTFERELNKETLARNLCFMEASKDESAKYTGIFINVIIAVIMGFAGFLFLIFLIIAGHNISTEMDIEYVNLGIMKSQGFTDGKIRIIYIFEYLVIAFFGIIVGMVLSVPFERAMGRIFIPMTSLVPQRKTPVTEGVMIGLVIMAVLIAYIFLLTRRVTRNSPAKAITRGKEDVYFSSSMQLPVTKRGLNFTMGLRSLTAAPKRYLSIVFITILLVFFAITITLAGTFIRSDNSIESMGIHINDITFSFPEDSSIDETAVENEVLKYTGITSREYRTNYVLSFDGESFGCDIEAYPREDVVYRGRQVERDNEIIITEAVGKILNLDIGDTVTVGFEEHTREYMIVGMFQTMWDLGEYTAMSIEGFRALAGLEPEEYTIRDNMYGFGIVLDDESYAEQIVKDIQSKYGEDDLKIEVYDRVKFLNSTGEMFYVAADGSSILIYVITFLFALITVIMVCTKVFIQERTDIGISHAIGFSTTKIRLQFAARFAIVCMISAIFGVILARLYADDILSLIFSLFGINRIKLEYNEMCFIIPAAATVICYSIFGYLASRKVKKVSTRELVIE